MDTAREIGGLEARVERIEKDVNEIKGDVKILLGEMSGRRAVSGFLHYVLPFGAVGVSLAALLRGG